MSTVDNWTTVESFKFEGPMFVGCGIFAYRWGCNFVDVSAFSLNRKQNPL